jgi:exosortase
MPLLAGVRKYAPRVLLFVLIFGIWARPAADLAREWWTEASASQGLVIAPLAAALLWLNRREMLRIPAAPSHYGHLLVAAAGFIFLAGKFGADLFLERVSIIALLVGLTWAFWGRGRLRKLIFPLLLLAAAIPLPAVLYNDVSQHLQLFASDASTRLAQLCGTPVSRDGNILRLPGISLGVEEACNGLNSIFALGLTGALLARYRNQHIRGLLLIPLGVMVGVAVNIVRITATAILAGHDRRFATGFYHIFSGWLVFVIGFIVLILASRAVTYYGRLDSSLACTSGIDDHGSGQPSRRHAETAPFVATARGNW